MTQKYTLILTTGKLGHYSSYGDLFSRIASGDSVVKETAGLREVLLCSKLVLVDGDSTHLFYFIHIWIRSLLGRPTVLFSVRTEDLLAQRWQSRIKKEIVLFLNSLRKVDYLSIHYPGLKSLEGSLISRCIYDPQLWDLQYLNSEESAPPELVSFSECHRSVLVLGALNFKRCKDRLLAVVKSCPEISFIFAGKISSYDERQLKLCDNALVINRYVSDAEILHLYKCSGFVYAYYDLSVNRPSGIFGRAVQLGKPVIIRQGGYLDKYYSDYRMSVVLQNIEDILGSLKNDEYDFSYEEGGRFDHSSIIKEYF